MITFSVTDEGSAVCEECAEFFDIVGTDTTNEAIACEQCEAEIPEDTLTVSVAREPQKPKQQPATVPMSLWPPSPLWNKIAGMGPTIEDTTEEWKWNLRP